MKQRGRRPVTLMLQASALVLLLLWLLSTGNLLRIATVSLRQYRKGDTFPFHDKNTITGEDDENILWRYKSRMDSHGMPVTPPRFLLGIMSHEMKSPREADRRQMIRETYLKYFLDHGSLEERHRICSLRDLIDGTINEAECQIAYVFVIGQTQTLPSNNRTEFLDAVESSQMLLPHPSKDVLSMNIIENGKFGKSPTWFRYATLLIKERNLHFNYIIKTDSDTLLIPARFLRWVDEQEKKNNFGRAQIYGGTPLDKTACGWPSHDHCYNMTAPYFHGGGFYFSSIDIAEYIVSDQCPRSSLFVPHEDLTMGNYVHSMPNKTGLPIIGFKKQDGYQTHWIHPVKDPKRIRSLWRSYITKKTKRMKLKEGKKLL